MRNGKVPVDRCFGVRRFIAAFDTSGAPEGRWLPVPSLLESGDKSPHSQAPQTAFQVSE
jgi:hypothetical protein